MTFVLHPHLFNQKAIRVAELHCNLDPKRVSERRRNVRAELIDKSVNFEKFKTPADILVNRKREA
jgi:hypothetical protein